MHLPFHVTVVEIMTSAFLNQVLHLRKCRDFGSKIKSHFDGKKQSKITFWGKEFHIIMYSIYNYKSYFFSIPCKNKRFTAKMHLCTMFSAYIWEKSNHDKMATINNSIFNTFFTLEIDIICKKFNSIINDKFRKRKFSNVDTVPTSGRTTSNFSLIENIFSWFL